MHPLCHSLVWQRKHGACIAPILRGEGVIVLPLPPARQPLGCGGFRGRLPPRILHPWVCLHGHPPTLVRGRQHKACIGPMLCGEGVIVIPLPPAKQSFGGGGRLSRLPLLARLLRRASGYVSRPAPGTPLDSGVQRRLCPHISTLSAHGPRPLQQWQPWCTASFPLPLQSGRQRDGGWTPL